jgi:hypothetical protein
MEQSCISSETALTSSCFIAELLPQNEMLASWKSSRPFMELSKVTLVGEYKKLKVCFPSKTKMCTEPECTSCKEKEVFVPCQIVKSP